MRHHPRPFFAFRGFSLLELSVVLVIIAVVMGGVMVLFTQGLGRRALQETQTKQQAIQTALLNYRRAFNRIPCPADVTIAMTTANFGVEVGTVGNGGCSSANFSLSASSFTGTTTNGSAVVTSVSSVTNLSPGTVVTGTGIPTATAIKSVDSSSQITLSANATASGSPTLSFNSVVEGMVPVKTLGLPDDYAIDGWGKRMMYAVDVNATMTDAFSYLPTTDAATNRITVKDAGASTVTQGALYLLLSFGANGHGAYPRQGGSTRLVNYVSADANELDNCNCNSSAAATSFDTSFVQKLTTGTHLASFDDIIVYASRGSLRGGAE